MPTPRKPSHSPRSGYSRRPASRRHNDRDIRGRYDYDSDYISTGLSQIMNYRTVNNRSLSPIALDCDRTNSDGYLTSKQLLEYHPRQHPEVARERSACRPNAEYVIRGDGRFKCASTCLMVDASGVTSKVLNNGIYGNYSKSSWDD